MSLRGVHIVFIVSAALAALFFGGWAWQKGMVAASGLAAIFALALMIYAVVFLRKIKI